VDIPCGEAIWRRTDPKTRWREAKREREREWMMASQPPDVSKEATKFGHFNHSRWYLTNHPYITPAQIQKSQATKCLILSKATKQLITETKIGCGSGVLL
jgi:hypothetical protein